MSWYCPAGNTFRHGQLPCKCTIAQHLEGYWYKKARKCNEMVATNLFCESASFMLYSPVSYFLDSTYTCLLDFNAIKLLPPLYRVVSHTGTLTILEFMGSLEDSTLPSWIPVFSHLDLRLITVELEQCVQSPRGRELWGPWGPSGYQAPVVLSGSAHMYWTLVPGSIPCSKGHRLCGVHPD